MIARDTYGIDVSHYQDSTVFNNCEGLDFCIMKASEGVSIRDDKILTHTRHALGNGLLVGFYHYARPEYNDAISEANHFITVVSDVINDEPILRNKSIILALDWEGNALKYNAEWAVEWLNRVKLHFKIKPLIYCSISSCKKLKKVYEAGYDLWVANYTGTPFKFSSNYTLSPWHRPTIHQYTNKPIDKNAFNGSRELLDNTFKPTISIGEQLVDRTTLDYVRNDIKAIRELLEHIDNLIK